MPPSRTTLAMMLGDDVGDSAFDNLVGAETFTSADTFGAEGDPFFGGLLRVVGRGLGRVVGGKLSRSRVSGAIQRAAQSPTVAAAAGAVLGAGAEALLGGTRNRRAMRRERMRMRGARGCPTGRRRRMRVTNPKALRRAIRRTMGFAKLARKVLSFTSRRPPTGRPIFRRKAKRRI